MNFFQYVLSDFVKEHPLFIQLRAQYEHLCRCRADLDDLRQRNTTEINNLRDKVAVLEQALTNTLVMGNIAEPRLSLYKRMHMRISWQRQVLRMMGKQSPDLAETFWRRQIAADVKKLKSLTELSITDRLRLLSIIENGL